MISLSRAAAGMPLEADRYAATFGMLFLASSLATAQLLIHGGLPVAHDMVFHLFQADQFHRAIQSGTLLPHWAMSANNGYGAPNFIFYAPLSYYLFSLIRVFTASPVTALIIAIWSSFLFSGVAMYLAAKRISGSRGALPAALLYQLLPFHLLNLYGRGAFAELTAYAWFPLIILFMSETLTGRHSPLAAAGLALSYAGLILTHLVSAFMFTLVLFLYAICHHYSRRSGKALLAASSAMAVGIGLSAFYLLPVMFERKYVQMGYMFNYIFSDYRNNFLFLKNGFDSSFRMALHGAAILEIIFFLSVVILLLRGEDKHSDRVHLRALCIIFIAATFLVTPLSAPLWKIFPGFALLQFPWRFVSVMELSLCFLTGALFSGIGRREPLTAGPGTRMALYGVIAILSLSTILILNSGGMHAASFLARITDAGQATRYTNLPKEYTPVWASDVEKTVTEEVVERISALSGRGGVRILKWAPERRVFAVNYPSPDRLRITTFYYPGWEATIDDKRRGIAIEEKSGAMLVDTPPGPHIIELSFHSTPLRDLSMAISIGSGLILAFLTLFSLKNARTGQTGK